MSIPAHKVVGDEHKPGQIVNTSTWTPPDQSLGDYLSRKQRYAAFDTVALERVNTVKKLSFEEWAHTKGITSHVYYHEYKACWKAAQENV